ncbi:MAG: hypothetical protein IJY90_01925 [Clostridia bacterium]|nr:hypothetical protein [Clostridia bacterium]
MKAFDKINSSAKEQLLFSKALKELFFAICSPRYLLCKRFYGKKIYRYALQVPTDLAKNKSVVYLFKFLMFMFKGFETVYCKGKDENKKTAMLCQAHGYNKSFYRPITQKQILD